MSEPKKILVLGATGNQGGSVLEAVQAASHDWSLRAMVRDPGAPAALALAQRGIEIVKGDFEQVETLRAAMDGCYGVFSVQTPLGPGGVEAEERHGTNVVEAAASSNVGHFVHSSVGGAETPRGVFWREAKLRTETRIRKSGIPATFVRPTYFMDNFLKYPPLLENQKLVYRRGLASGVTLQMIWSHDIGRFVVDIFDDGSTIGEAIELAGDALTGEEIADVFSTHTGIDALYEPQDMDELREHSPWQATAYQWLNEVGYNADIERLRSRHPDMLTLSQWLQLVSWQPSLEHVAPPSASVPKALS